MSDSNIDARFARILELLDANRISEAESIAKEMIDTEPNDPVSWNAYGIVNEEKRDYVSASRGYEKSLAIESNPVVGGRLGICYDELEMYKEAVPLLNKAINSADAEENVDEQLVSLFSSMEHANGFDATISAFPTYLKKAKNKDFMYAILTELYLDKALSFTEECEGQKVIASRGDFEKYRRNVQFAKKCVEHTTVAETKERFNAFWEELKIARKRTFSKDLLKAAGVFFLFGVILCAAGEEGIIPGIILMTFVFGARVRNWLLNYLYVRKKKMHIWGSWFNRIIDAISNIVNFIAVSSFKVPE